MTTKLREINCWKLGIIYYLYLSDPKFGNHTTTLVSSEDK